jgi:hypothetical protein
MSPDTVVLEIFTLEVSGEFDAAHEAVWQALDEQHLPAETRLRLAANGIGCGRCGLQLPLPLFDLIEESQPAAGEPGSPGPAPAGLLVRRLQSRSGRRGRIVMNGPHERLEVLRSEAGEMRGEVYEQATCVLAVRTFPLGDGRARVELTPEIEHGPLKQRLVEGEGALRWEAGQERRVYDDLCMESLLAPGQTLVLSAAASPAGLGRSFFVKETAAGLRPVFLVVRLTQTQHDDRFGAGQAVAPIATPNE